MQELSELRASLFAHLDSYARALRRGAVFVKVLLYIGGAALASVALTLDLTHATHEISAWTIAGLIGAGLVTAGAVFDALRETDAAKTLVEANRAIDAAHERQQALDVMMEEQDDFDGAVTRGLELYNSMDVMRGVIEQSLSFPDVPLDNILQNCLNGAGDSLLVAFGFELKDIWTICIFMAQPAAESGKVILRCVAHLRKIPCEVGKARAWPEGVGVAGIAYSTNNEIIIQDMSSPEVTPFFELGANARSYDKERYASMVAAPITVGSDPKPWGVAVVTSDRVDHFTTGPSYGVAAAEPIRAIAAMVALAAKADGLRRVNLLRMDEN
jgi:hypothetical protein